MSARSGTALLAASAATVGLALALTACFSERTSGPGGAVGGECNVPVSVIDSGQVVVAISNFLFAPDSVRVPVGATVTWVNCENIQTEPHTTTSDAGLWDSGEYPGGQRFSHAFPGAGTFLYHCSAHPFMVGKVVVQ